MCKFAEKGGDPWNIEVRMFSIFHDRKQFFCS